MSTIVNVGNTALWPIKWFNERTKMYFEDNLKKYEKKLEEIPEEKITEVPTEISNPILDRFTYVSNEELSSAFINLLTSASSNETVKYAHPGFIQIIDRISPDEARILKYLSFNDSIPVLNIKHHYNPEKLSQYKLVIKGRTGLEDKIDLNFQENLITYLNNLESLGLIRERNFYFVKLETEFEKIEKKLENEINLIFSHYNGEELKKYKKEEKKMYEITDFGYMFIKACIG